MKSTISVCSNKTKSCSTERVLGFLTMVYREENLIPICYSSQHFPLVLQNS
jgi:hypothetical protein